MSDLVKFSELIPLVRVETPECPNVLIQNAITRAAIEFCEKSTFWRETIDTLYTTDNVEEYDLDTPYGAVLSDIIWVQYDGTPLSSKTESQLLAYTSGTTAYYSLLNPRVLKLAPTPSTGKKAKIRAALKPKPSATAIRDYVYDEWSEAFYHGALQRLFVMPNKPWSSPELSLHHGAEFNEAVSTALNLATNNSSNVSYVVQYGGI
jgi:hypothetical protein